MLGDKANMLFD